MITKAEWTDRRLLLPKRHDKPFLLPQRLWHSLESWLSTTLQVKTRGLRVWHSRRHEHHAVPIPSAGCAGVPFRSFRTWGSSWSCFILWKTSQAANANGVWVCYSIGCKLPCLATYINAKNYIHTYIHTYIYICNYITHITHIYTYSVDVSKCNIPIAFGHPDGSQWLEAGQMERYLIPPSCTSFTGSQNWMMGKSAGNPRNHYNSW